MNLVINKLLGSLGKKPLVIWGARMTGIGFLRFAKKHNLNPIGFVDSDPALSGKKIGSFYINNPNTIQSLKAQYQDLIVIVAVSLKEDEIISSLKGMGVSGTEYVNYHDLCGTFFTIDVAGSCNLKCPSCPQSFEELNPKGFMSLNYFKQVIEKITNEVDIVSHISLYSWGEPFLHPKLPSIIEYSRSQGIAVAVSTNLSIIRIKQIEEIIKSSPDYLKISISGYYPNAYNSTHTGGDINLVKSNLYRLRYYMDKYNVTTFVDVNYHLYKNNIGKDLDQIKELCTDLNFTLSPSYAIVMPVERLIDYCEGGVDEKTSKLANLLLVGIEKGLEIAKPYKHLPCRFLTNQVNIHWDGSVPLCCVTFDRKTSTIANDFLKISLKDLSKRKDNHPQCVKCVKNSIPPYMLNVNLKEWDKEARKFGFLEALG